MLIVAGSFGDLLGRKRIFIGGIVVFGIASLAAGIAQSPAQLIAARVVQGAAAAMMIPQLLATFRAMFGRDERGKAFGMYGAILGFASAIGLVFAVWIQIGMGFSPLAAGLTALAFSAGSFLLAPMAVPFAQRYGRLVLAGGGILMALGTLGVVLGAAHVGTGSDPWPIVPGLVFAGAGLSLLIIPLVNVVLAAVPHEVAGGGSSRSSSPRACSRSCCHTRQSARTR